MKNLITVRVQLDDGTIVERCREIERIGNRQFLAYETLAAGQTVTTQVVEMLIANHPLQIRPPGITDT